MDCQNQRSPATCGSLQVELHLSISAARQEGRGHVIPDISMWRPFICGATGMEWNWLYSLLHGSSIKRPQHCAGYIDMFTL